MGTDGRWACLAKGKAVSFCLSQQWSEKMKNANLVQLLYVKMARIKETWDYAKYHLLNIKEILMFEFKWCGFLLQDKLDSYPPG